MSLFLAFLESMQITSRMESVVFAKTVFVYCSCHAHCNCRAAALCRARACILLVLRDGRLRGSPRSRINNCPPLRGLRRPIPLELRHEADILHRVPQELLQHLLEEVLSHVVIIAGVCRRDPLDYLIDNHRDEPD